MKRRLNVYLYILVGLILVVLIGILAHFKNSTLFNKSASSLGIGGSKL